MKKKGLVLMTVLFCMASLMVAMAYTSAEVETGYTIRVVNTEEALLALIPNDQDKDGTAFMNKDGNLELDFGRIGNEGHFSGLQPGSIYEWEGLVSVQNNSQNKIKVDLTVDGPAADYLTVTAGKGNNSNKGNNGNNGNNKGNQNNGWQIKNLELNPNDKLPLNFKIVLPQNVKVGQNFTGDIVVSATV